MIDGSDPDLLAEQAVDDAAGDDETEDDEKRCRTWPGLDHCPPLVLLTHGRMRMTPSDRVAKYLCRARGQLS